MNLRNWSKYHTLGLLIGLIGPLLYLPGTVFVLSKLQNMPFIVFWNKFLEFKAIQGKFISLSIIPNLGWFYLFLNKERYPIAMGIIIGSALYIPFILYVNFS